MMLPSLYISHGSPALVIMNNQTTDFLSKLPRQFKKPKTILVISAHWVTKELRILSNENPNIIYDFYNFPRELYEQKYPAKNNLIKVNEITQLIESKGLRITQDSMREGYDHGVWSILKLMYPNADIPVVQLSLPISYDAKELVKLGEILQPLKEDTLIIASGAMTHNLAGINWFNEEAKPVEYATIFRDWIVNKLEKSDVEALINFETQAPMLRQNHPSTEHFIPLFVPLGASETKKGEALHDIYMYGNQSMDAILFKH